MFLNQLKSVNNLSFTLYTACMTSQETNKSRARIMRWSLIWCFLRLLCWQLCLTVARCVCLDSSLPADGLKEHTAYATHDLAKLFFFFFFSVDSTWWWWCGYTEDDLHPKCFPWQGGICILAWDPACLHSTRQTVSSTNTYASIGAHSCQCSIMQAKIKQRKRATSSDMMQDDSQCSCFLHCVFCNLFIYWWKRPRLMFKYDGQTNDKSLSFIYFAPLFKKKVLKI